MPSYSSLPALADRHQRAGIDLSRSCIRLSTLDAIPREVAEHDRLLPVLSTPERLIVAIADPETAEAVEAEMSLAVGVPVEVVLAPARTLLAVLEEAYDAYARCEPFWRGLRSNGRAGLALVRPWSPGARRPVPAAPANPSLETAIRESAKRTSPGRRALVELPRSRRALVASVDEGLRAKVERELKSAGFAVTCVRTAQEAAFSFLQAPPEAVVLDLDCGDGDTPSLARSLEIDSGAPVRVVLLAPLFADRKHAEAARTALGADECLAPAQVAACLGRGLQKLLDQPVRERGPSALALPPAQDLRQRERALSALRSFGRLLEKGPLHASYQTPAQRPWSAVC